jgi:hypothetical protein
MPRQRKNKVRVEKKTQKRNATEIRRKGIEALQKAGIRVFMTDEEWKTETEECKMQWGDIWLKNVLTRGPAFRFTPPKLNDDEKEIAINRTVTSMAVEIRLNLVETRTGKPRTQAETWQLDKGLRIGAHKWYKTPQPTTLKGMQDKLQVEIDKGFEVEMRGERPEKDAGGRKKVKQRKIRLKGTGQRLKEFRDTWVAREDEKVEMRQRDDEEEEERERERTQRKRKRQEDKTTGKKQDDNMHERELQALTRLAEHKFKFRVQRADKGGATVVISENRMNEESRGHVENDKAYEKASNFGNVLGKKPEGSRKYQGAILDGKQKEWPSTLDSIPENVAEPKGLWKNEEEVIESLWERMEWFLLRVMPQEYEELPGTILCNILARGFEQRGDGTWDEPNMAQNTEGGTWGLGEVVKERREKAEITPIEVLMKLHKTPIKSRPVGRAMDSQMKVYEQLVGGVLTQVLEDIENDRVRQGKKRIVLTSTLPYAKTVEDINKTWEEEFSEGKKLNEGVEILGYDVVALYPSLKLEFMIRMIDKAMVLRIETKKGEEKEKAIQLRNIIMPLVIFMLEHQFCSTVGKDGEKMIWRQVTGISIGSSCSGILANLTLLMAEIDMLDKLETQGIRLSAYNRYVDDITAISDVKEKNKKGELFKMLEAELNNLDPIGDSIRVTGEQIYADRVSKQADRVNNNQKQQRNNKQADRVNKQTEKEQPEKEQGLAYLDLWQKLVRGTSGQIKLECGIYRKKAAADMYILPSSAHSKKLKQGILKGEFLRFVTLCSTEKEYDKASDRYSKALQTRGYSAHEVDNVREHVKWENKKDILIKREEKKKKGKGQAPGIPVVIEDKPGLGEWWEACTREGITNSFRSFFSEAEVALLPDRLFKCMRTTESLADFVKKKGRR